MRAGTDTETPRKGDEVTINFAGSFLDGRLFDDSRKRDQSLSFKLDNGRPNILLTIRHIKSKDISPSV